jgi:hypothetical protein
MITIIKILIIIFNNLPKISCILSFFKADKVPEKEPKTVVEKVPEKEPKTVAEKVPQKEPKTVAEIVDNTSHLPNPERD